MEEKEYNFKIKNGDVEIELSSTDENFVKEQMKMWQEKFLK